MNANTNTKSASKQLKFKINTIWIEQHIDESPDTSFLGEYTEEQDSWNIYRKTGEYVNCIEKRKRLIDEITDKIDDIEEDIQSNDPHPIVRKINKIKRLVYWRDKIEASGETEIEKNHREYTFFRPYTGGEKPGTPEYIKYGLQDYERMEQLNDGIFSFVGIIAKAEIWNPESHTTQTIRSSGLWGIESDSGEYIQNDVIPDELNNLKCELKALGFGKRAIEYAFKTKYNTTIIYK